MRTKQHADGPLMRERRNVTRSQRGRCFERKILLPDVKDIACAQSSSRRAAKASEHKRAAAAEIWLCIEGSLDCEVRANAFL